MIALTFRIERKDNGGGYPIAFVVHDGGVRRRASEEEAALWDALQASGDRKGPPAEPVTPPASPPRSRR